MSDKTFTCGCCGAENEADATFCFHCRATDASGLRKKPAKKKPAPKKKRAAKKR